MDINDDVLSMPKGWVIKYEDGTLITEYDRNGVAKDWRSVPKKGIKTLSLKWNNKHWTIHGKDNYLQKKRGWVIPQLGEQAPNIQYRYIGYWEGNDKVFYRVDELTGEMKMIVESIDS